MTVIACTASKITFLCLVSSYPFAYLAPCIPVFHTLPFSEGRRRHQSLAATPSVVSHQPSATSHQPSVISHQSSAISHQPSAISHQSSTISHQPSTINHQPSAVEVDTSQPPTAPRPLRTYAGCNSSCYRHSLNRPYYCCPTSLHLTTPLNLTTPHHIS